MLTTASSPIRWVRHPGWSRCAVRRSVRLACAQIESGIAALFTGQLTASLEFVSSLTRQLHIPLFLSSPDRQTKVEYYFINVYPHYTATSQAFSDLIKFQQWEEVAIITERAESKERVGTGATRW